MKVKKIVEASTSRIYHHLTSGKDFAMISAYRSDNTVDENKKLQNQLKKDVRALGYGFIEFISKWVEDNFSSDEESLFIPNIKKEEIINLGKKYKQSSIIFNDKEYCTTPFENYKPGDIVRTYNLNKNEPMNLKDAEEIFAGRLLNRAVSKPKKGSNSKPFTLELSEVYEVIPAKPTTFREPRLYKIY